MRCLTELEMALLSTVSELRYGVLDDVMAQQLVFKLAEMFELPPACASQLARFDRIDPLPRNELENLVRCLRKALRQ